MKIAIVGGDLRNRYLLEELSRSGFACGSAALGGPSIPLEDLSAYDLIVGPVPFSRDEVHLYTPLAEEKIRIEDFLSRVGRETLVFTGTLGPRFTCPGTHIDLTKNEKLYECTVRATVEGILQIILNSVDFTISGSSVLVLGFGRIGKPLSKLFDAVGARVSAYSVDEKEIKEIRERFTLARISDLSDQDIIINTIPAVVLDESNIPSIRKGTVIVDVASAPGGVDAESAGKHGVPYTVAPGIPGKKAPLSVARVMKEIILEYDPTIFKP